MSHVSRAAIPALCVSVSAALLLLATTRAAHSFPDEPRTPTKWEYSTATIDIGSLAGTLSELGTQGWEVFSVDHVASVLEQQNADGKTRLVAEKMQVTAKRPLK